MYIKADGDVLCDSALDSEHLSVAYYHNKQPIWNEVLKISLVPVEFAECHLKFTFSHISKKENKRYPPFALAFLKLTNDTAGNALHDQEHELGIFKIKKPLTFDSSSSKYLDLKFYRNEILHNPESIKVEYG